MGFLGLFSRKASSSKLFSRGLKGQAYEATVASAPPVRGDYPVAGNGPNVLAHLARSSRLDLAELSAEVNADLSAPAPAVPRFRGEQSVERPKTAPIGNQAAPSASSWAKGLGKRRSSLRHSLRGSPLKQAPEDAPPVPALTVPAPAPAPAPAPPPKNQTPEFAQYGAGFEQVFPPPQPAPATRPTTAITASPSPLRSLPRHQRTNSVLSDSCRSVDLLDAQSEISHSDFRARVQAAGVREYGEDVADRNLAVNSFNLDSVHVQTFYQSTPKGGRPLPNREVSLMVSPNLAMNTVTAQSPLNSNTMVPAGLRTKTLNSSAAHLFPPRTTSTTSSPGSALTGATAATTATSAPAPSLETKTIITYKTLPRVAVPKGAARLEGHLSPTAAPTSAKTKTPSHSPGPRSPLTTYVPTGSTASSGVVSNTSAKMRPLDASRSVLTQAESKGYYSTSPVPDASVPERPATSWEPNSSTPRTVRDPLPMPRHYVPSRREDVSTLVDSSPSKKSRLSVAVAMPSTNASSSQDPTPSRGGGLPLRTYQPTSPRLGSTSGPSPSSNRGSVPPVPPVPSSSAFISDDTTTRAPTVAGKRPSARRHTLHGCLPGSAPAASTTTDEAMPLPFYVPSRDQAQERCQDRRPRDHPEPAAAGSRGGPGGFADARGAESVPSPFTNSSHMPNNRRSSSVGVANTFDPNRESYTSAWDQRPSTSYSRSRSLVFPRPGYLEEIYEHIPERTSSLRNWSLTSTTPTTSSQSSNPFGSNGARPQSRHTHTANTSVDLSFATKSLTFSSTSLPFPPPSSRGSIYVGGSNTTAAGRLMSLPTRLDGPDSPAAAHHQQQRAVTPPPMSLGGASGGFNIDDYISSDDDADSFTNPNPRHPRGEGEEALLFRDDGFSFPGLPGLADSFDFFGAAAPAPTVLRPPRHFASQPRRMSSPTTPAPQSPVNIHLHHQQQHPPSPPQSPQSVSSFTIVVRGRSTHRSPVRGRSRHRRYVVDSSHGGSVSSVEQGGGGGGNFAFNNHGLGPPTGKDYIHNANVTSSCSPTRPASSSSLILSSPQRRRHSHSQPSQLQRRGGASGGGGGGSKRLSASATGTFGAASRGGGGRGRMPLSPPLFTAPAAAASPRVAAGDDVIEEERTEKIDVAAAVRLRKEAKARKRASAVAVGRKQRASTFGAASSSSNGNGSWGGRNREGEEKAAEADADEEEDDGSSTVRAASTVDKGKGKAREKSRSAATSLMAPVGAVRGKRSRERIRIVDYEDGHDADVECEVR